MVHYHSTDDMTTRNSYTETEKVTWYRRSATKNQCTQTWCMFAYTAKFYTCGVKQGM